LVPDGASVFAAVIASRREQRPSLLTRSFVVVTEIVVDALAERPGTHTATAIAATTKVRRICSERTPGASSRHAVRNRDDFPLRRGAVPAVVTSWQSRRTRDRRDQRSRP